MRVAGLDPGTVTGWCVRGVDGSVLAGEWDFTPKRPTKSRPPEPWGLRFWRFHRAFNLFLAEEGISAVVIEDTHSRSTRATQVLAGFVTVALVLLHDRGIDYVFCPSSTMKSFAKTQGVDPVMVEKKVGGTKKRLPDMKAPMRFWAELEVFGQEITDNVSDAFWLMRWGEENLRPVIPETESSSTLRIL